jgi:hypothetical protein
MQKAIKKRKTKGSLFPMYDLLGNRTKAENKRINILPFVL